MNNNTILVAALALIIGGASVYLITDRSSNYRNTPVGMHRMSDGTLMNNTSNTGMGGMMGNMDHGMMMVSSEKEFITEMIPHHQEAVDTAKEVLARGATTPEIKSLMENIVSAQEKEIADMKNWYQSWYGTPYQPSGNYKPMMRDLEGLSGKEIDKVFLEDMVMHHMGAIMMAHSVQAYIEHDEIKILTKAIVDSQSEEIELMRKLRAGL
jgi:uncharacterized protein (DUF305 family)